MVVKRTTKLIEDTHNFPAVSTIITEIGVP